MNREAEERLGLYLDGELTDAERVEVETWLAASAEARGALRAQQAVGDAVRAIETERRQNAPDLTDEILALIEREAVPVERRDTGGAARGDGSAPLGSRVRWLRLAPPVGLAVAAAAAVALLLRGPEDEARPGPRTELSSVATESPLPSEPAQAAELAAAEPAEPAEPEVGASIESVDFGTHNGTIFMVAGGADVTPVVWLVDEPDPAEDRMAPL